MFAIELDELFLLSRFTITKQLITIEMRIVTIIFICLFSFMSATAQGLKEMSFGTEETLDIASWNIEWFPKNGMVTVDSVKEAIAALEFDVLGIQEVDDTTVFKNMIAELPNYTTTFKTSYFAGLAYIYNPSTIEVLDYYEIYSSNPYWNAFPRSPKILEFMFQGQKFITINNHFKCCGNGSLDYDDTGDEENRRLQASNLLKMYIDTNFPDDNVILLGDLNDLLTDAPVHNVFQEFFAAPGDYKFIDMDIAEGPSDDWSYPSWPSHLDHILITNELFDDMENEDSKVETIRIGDFMAGGFNEYDQKMSDHRPMGLKLSLNEVSTVGLEEEHIQMESFPNPAVDVVSFVFEKTSKEHTLVFYDISGRKVDQLTVPANEFSVFWELSDIPSGIYLARLMDGELLKGTKKIIVQ